MVMVDNMGRCKVKFIKENIMGPGGVTPPTSPPPKGKPEAAAQGGGGENGGGVLNKLEGEFFEEKGVSDIALRIAHDIPPEDTVNGLAAPEGASKAYLKLLARYEEQYPPPPPPPVAQVDTLTVGGTIEEGDKFTITLEGESDPVEFEAGGETNINEVVAKLVTAWNTAFGTDITAAAGDAGSGIFTLTANTAGVPFSVTVEPTNADGEPEDVPTFDSETTTENVGAAEVTVEGTTEPDPDIVPPEPDPDIVPSEPFEGVA